MTKISDFLDSRGKWQCTKCGACCSFIAPAADADKFPREWVMIDGGCKWLDRTTKLCTIYETRPPICRISNTLKDLTDNEKAVMCGILKQHQDEKNERMAKADQRIRRALCDS